MTARIFKTPIALIAALLFTACYDDKGGNDFDTPMADVEIILPSDTYSGSIGQSITITPEIATDIPDKDLTYHWEVKGARSNEYGRSFFAPLVNEDKQQRTLDYTCHLDSNIVALNKTYTCRLRVHQVSTGRDFYSAAPFTITIEGITGLMVLHGDESSSDVGMLMADEFMPKTSALPEEASAIGNIYSVGAGQKLQGVGKQIVQLSDPYINSYSDDKKDLCHVFVKTANEAKYLSRNDLSLVGDWNSRFYLQGDRAVNSGKADGLFVNDSWVCAFDGTDVFINKLTQTKQYLFATYSATTACADGNCYTFVPALLHTGTNGIQWLMYSATVNGKRQKGFVAVLDGEISTLLRNTALVDTRDDAVSFNPGNMQADLLTMAQRADKHVIAVMQGDADNPAFSGKKFLAELYLENFGGGNSGYASVPQARYDMSGLTDIDQAFAFAFGSTSNMSYYATPLGVYRYGIDGTSLTAAQKLCDTSGQAIDITGEVTMMKRLDSPDVTTHFSDEILLVATWNGTVSSIYALYLDTMTGNVSKAVKYGADNVAGWNFGKIYDVNIKAL